VDNKTIRKHFVDEYGGGRNVFTPNIHAYGYSLKNENIIFEISYGDGISSRYQVGVTVLELLPNGERTRRCDLSESGHQAGDNKWNLLSLAREYAEALE